MVIKNYEFYIELFTRILKGERFFSITNKDLKDAAIDITEKKNVQAIIGASLRHCLFFNYCLTKKFNITDEKLLNTLIFLINDLIFTKRYKKEDLIDTAKDASKEVKVINVEDIFNYFIEKTPFELLKDEFATNLTNFKCLSLRYNVPEWIVNMFVKHYGISHTLNSMKCFSSKQKVLVSKYDRFAPDFQFNERYFTKLDLENLYLYIGKDSIKKSRDLSNFTIYQTNYLDKLITSKIKISQFDNIAIFDDTKTNLVIDIFGKARNQNIINFFSSDFGKITKTLEFVRKNKEQKLFYDQCKATELESRISRKVNLFVLIPESSNFSNVNSAPEHLINFDNTKLNELIENQKAAIRACAQQVLIGGNLVYVTYTLDKKENELIIEEFLKENKGYNKVEEKVFYPSNKDSTCGYFAILHREF